MACHIVGPDGWGCLRRKIDEIGPSSVFVVADEGLERVVLPRMTGFAEATGDAPLLLLPPGEENKNIETVARVWTFLSQGGATRRSLLINVGGGKVTDLGGFAAATFKRGIRYINIPTTLLGAVDASTGGKTGVNFGGRKNEVGAFAAPEATFVDTRLFATLPRVELLSGYAEMLKTALIDDAAFAASLLDVEGNLSDLAGLSPAVERCLDIKERIVASDPLEKGLRKVLNFGHTAGHALESLSYERGAGVAHGVAVAYGMLVELVLSRMLAGMASDILYQYASEVLPSYPRTGISCRDSRRLLELMGHDKKNAVAGEVNFTLLSAPGCPLTDCVATGSEIQAALDIAADLAGGNM